METRAPARSRGRRIRTPPEARQPSSRGRSRRVVSASDGSPRAARPGRRYATSSDRASAHSANAPAHAAAALHVAERDRSPRPLSRVEPRWAKKKTGEACLASGGADVGRPLDDRDGPPRDAGRAAARRPRRPRRRARSSRVAGTSRPSSPSRSCRRLSICRRPAAGPRRQLPRRAVAAPAAVRTRSDATDEPHDLAEDPQVLLPFPDDDGPHGRMLRPEEDGMRVAREPLHGRLAVDQRHHDVAGWAWSWRRTSTRSPSTMWALIMLSPRTRSPKTSSPRPADPRGIERQRALAILLGEERGAGGDPPENGHLVRLRDRHGQRERPRRPPRRGAPAEDSPSARAPAGGRRPPGASRGSARRSRAPSAGRRSPR